MIVVLVLHDTDMQLLAQYTIGERKVVQGQFCKVQTGRSGPPQRTSRASYGRDVAYLFSVYL